VSCVCQQGRLNVHREVRQAEQMEAAEAVADTRRQCSQTMVLAVAVMAVEVATFLRSHINLAVVAAATFPRNRINRVATSLHSHTNRVAEATRALIHLLKPVVNTTRILNLVANTTRTSRQQRDIQAARNDISSGNNSQATANSTRRGPCTARIRIRNSISDTRTAASTCARISLCSCKATRSSTTRHISSNGSIGLNSNEAICPSSNNAAIRLNNRWAISRGSAADQVPRAYSALLAVRSRAITGPRLKFKAPNTKFDVTAQSPVVLAG